MRIYRPLFLVACLLCLSMRLQVRLPRSMEQQPPRNHGRRGAGKGASKSIGGVFDSLNKTLRKATGEAAENSNALPEARRRVLQGGHTPRRHPPRQNGASEADDGIRDKDWDASG